MYLRDFSNLVFWLKILLISWRDTGKSCYESESCDFRADISILALGTSKFFDLQVHENWHKLGQGRRKNHARIILPRPDEPRTDRPPHIVPSKTSIGVGIPITFPNIENYRLLLINGIIPQGCSTDPNRIISEVFLN